MLKKNIVIASIGLIALFSGCSESDGFSTSTTTQHSDEVKKAPIVEVSPSDWYIRLVAEDTTRALKTESSQLGELDEDNASQQHTLKALSPFGGSYLDIVFVDPADVPAGEYKTNFHQYISDEEDRWPFTVKSDDANAEISLTWRGVFVLTPYIDDQGRQRYKEYRSVTNPLTKHMKLIDLQTLDEVPAVIDSQVQTYTFNMDGNDTRSFEWVRTIDEVNILQPVSRRSAARENLTQEDLTIIKAEVEQRKAETFDLSKPPVFLEKK